LTEQAVVDHQYSNAKWLFCCCGEVIRENGWDINTLQLALMVLCVLTRIGIDKDDWNGDTTMMLDEKGIYLDHFSLQLMKYEPKDNDFMNELSDRARELVLDDGVNKEELRKLANV
jgi:hypothetical protein